MDADQGYSHIVGKVQAGTDGREVGTKTAEGEKVEKMMANLNKCKEFYSFNSEGRKTEASVKFS